MCIFHSWSKWEQYEQSFTRYLRKVPPGAPSSFQYIEHWQKRDCTKCGKQQQEEIRGS